MNPIRIFLILGSIILLFSGLIHMMTSLFVTTDTDPMVSAFDMSRPRAPSDARKLKNPIPLSGDAISNGKALYEGKGNCFVCHGMNGHGDGEAGVMLSPPPRNFTDVQFQRLRADGELFWTIRYGIPDTAMFAFVPRHLTEEEVWMIVHYLRTMWKEEEPM
ncbi:MAG: c-type cytochrome [Candidatus Manganitrophus sp. SB1]|nr:c-type cytochrome [Candidatus Manganitrophus morganii]